MKVIGLLAFYDERADHLTECIASIAEHGVDALVAVDGAYGLYPGGQGSSPPEQHDAIRQAASDWEMHLTLHVPPGPWDGNEVEKRTALMWLGHALAEPSADWLFVIDADETIIRAEDYRAVLEQTPCDVASVLHSEQGVRPRLQRRFFRAHPRGIRLEWAHYYYLDGDDRVLYGPGQIPTEGLDVELWHRPGDRDRQRLERREMYYRQRIALGVEVEI